MLPDEYVTQVLRRYEPDVEPDTPTARAAEEIPGVIAPWTGRCLMSVCPTGSWAKGTRIRGSTDLDLLILLGPRTHGTPEQIHRSLFAFLKRKGHTPIRHNVAIALQYRSLLIHLIPARQEWGSGDRVAIFETERGRSTVTNPSAHVQMIRESGRAEDIRAAKIWRDRHGLRFPSFYLELVVLDALRHRAHNQPAANLLGTLGYLGKSFAGTPFRDPANIENKVSTELTEHEQLAIASAAERTLREKDWSRIIG
ncbi:MAG: hypothetical protein R6X14_01905 [bacterium]